MAEQQATSERPKSRAPRSWHKRLDTHGDTHGFHVRLGKRHGALYTEDDETLLVTFEQGEDIRDAGGPQLPLGLAVAGRAGWSQLCLYCEGDTWFRAQEVYDLFDTLGDEGFFDDFDRVVFFGAGSCAYAAAAFSVISPGSEVLAIQPQASLDPRVCGWDDRFNEMRRTSFTDRYGFAPDMIEGANKAFVVFDPHEQLDAMHAALFTRTHVHKLRTPFLGSNLAGSLDDIGLLIPLLQSACKGTLTPEKFAELYRKRREFPQYLKRLLQRLEHQDRHYLIALLTRAALRSFQGPRFKRAFVKAKEALDEQGITLPPERPEDAA